jgi:hypothetical protein
MIFFNNNGYHCIRKESCDQIKQRCNTNENKMVASHEKNDNVLVPKNLTAVYPSSKLINMVCVLPKKLTNMVRVLPQKFTYL